MLWAVRGVGRGVPLRLTLLGDSIAYGIGATHPSHTLAPRLAALLQAAAHEVECEVHAVPGARSTQLGAQVEAVQGGFPQLVVVVIGANDVSHDLPPEVAAVHLQRAVRALRDRGAEVVVAPAPDLSVVPRLSPQMRETIRSRSSRLRELQVRAVLTEGGVVADPEGSTAAAFAQDASLFSPDGFHPSSAGYARIAAALAEAVLPAAARCV